MPPGGGSGPCLRHEDALNPNEFVMFRDLRCSNMISCQKSTWIYQNSVRKHEIRPETMMIYPMWTMFVHHENVSRSITKSPYVGNLTKLLANSSLLINLHGNSGSSHAYIQVCAFKNANDAGITSASSSWSLVAQQEILHVCCEIDNVQYPMIINSYLVHDTSCTDDELCSMYDKWSIFLMLPHEPQVLLSHVQASTSHLTPTGQDIIRAQEHYLLSLIVC